MGGGVCCFVVRGEEEKVFYSFGGFNYWEI